MTIRMLQAWNGLHQQKIVTTLSGGDEAALVAAGIATYDLDGPAENLRMAQLATDAAGISATIPAVGLEYVLPQGCTPAQFQAVHDSIVASGKRATIKFQLADNIALSAGITIDVSYVSVDFNSSKLTFSPTYGAAITFTGSAVSPYGQGITQVKNAELIGPGQANASSIGVFFDGNPSGGPGPSRFKIEGIVIHDFGIGRKEGNGSYLQTWVGGEIYSCGIGVWSPSGMADSYENPHFVGTKIFNNDIGLQVDNGHYNLTNCAVDYNKKQFVISNNSRVNAIGCHIESNLKRSSYVAGQTAIDLSGDGATFHMLGGRLIFTDGTGTDLDYIVNANTPVEYSGGAYFTNVTMQNCNPAQGYFSKGTGTVVIRNRTSISTGNFCVGLNPNYNLLRDGGFESAVTLPVDDVAVIKDGAAAPSTRLGATNVVISRDATTFRSGANSLKINKTAAAGTGAQITILVPVRDYASHHTGSIWYRNVTGGSGSFVVEFGYYTILYDTNYIPIVKDKALTINQTVNLSGSDTGWVELKSAIPHKKAYGGSTHVGFRINADSMGACALFIDDAGIHQM